MYEIKVDGEKCTGCEECIDVCIEDVYEAQDTEPVPVNIEDCSGCENCMEVCEQDAISIKEV